jgi:hypothetical protein
MDGCFGHKRAGQSLLETVVAPIDLRSIAMDLTMFLGKRVIMNPQSNV